MCCGECDLGIAGDGGRGRRRRFGDVPASSHQVKSRFALLGGKIAVCRGSGPDWRAGAGARVWSPLPSSHPLRDERWY